MKNKASKRIENKKKKMAALIEISKLNEHDRSLKKQHMNEAKTSTATDLEPTIKKPRTDADINGDEADINQSKLGASGKPKLSGVELQELRKMLRERTTKLRQQPLFKLRELGFNARLTVDLECRTPLFLSDLQHLIMYAQLQHHSPYSPSRWCSLEKSNRLSVTTVFIIENISLNDFLEHESDFAFLNSTFEFKLEVLAQNLGSDVVRDLSMVPLTGTQMKRFRTEFGTLQNAVLKSTELFDTVRNLFPLDNKDGVITPPTITLPPKDRFPRTQLLLSGWQMVEENYPLPIKGLMERKYVGYVLTKDKYKHVGPFSPMFGLDCEMCKTTTGDLELTRVSVVDEDLNTFYDTLVKPDNRITDYLTQFSGITPKMMKTVRTTLKDVQNDLRRLLPADAILVGQSLGNDLHALKMMHPYVIDTSIIFNITGERSRKTKLKTLSEAFLSEKIQEGDGGHCSTEDSSASLKLAQLKLTKSLYFGDAVMGSVQEIRTYPDLGTYNYATSMLQQVSKLDKTVLVVGLNEIGSKYKYYANKGKEKQKDSEKIKCLCEKSNKDVVRQLCNSMATFALNICHIKIDREQLEGSKTFRNINQWSKEIYDKMSTPGFAMVVFTGNEGHNGCCFIHVKKDV